MRHSAKLAYNLKENGLLDHTAEGKTFRYMKKKEGRERKEERTLILSNIV